MFTHIMVGSNDVEKSKEFYDAALGALGVPAGWQSDKHVFYQHEGGALGVTKPIDGALATPANGGTIGFGASNKEAVDSFHAAGLANGGSCAGEPGLRPNAPGKAYGAYLRDPDGNKICAFCQIQD